MREQSEQSLAEVSGAVEIDERSLQRIEAGAERPAEEILLLLISHFGMPEREAIKLWELADYDSDLPQQMRSDSEPLANKSTIMLLALDMRAMYSDGLEVNANKAGLTLTFTQGAGKSQSPVARVGVSYEQAEQVIRTLQQAMLQAKYHNGSKLLPPPKQQD